MKPRIPLFIDSDVVISSLLSPTGAATMLMHLPSVIRFTSNLALTEQKIVVERLGISPQDHVNLMKRLFFVTTVLKEDVQKFAHTVNDPLDAHIVAGSVASNVKFLVTYNMKDYRTEVINASWNIIVITPGFLLQYLRSR